jgi:predicted nucleic acid-binding protein
MDELLLDTTYILPLFGLKVNLRDFNANFPMLMSKFLTSYNPIALVESKWIILKLIKKNPSKREDLLEAYRVGMNTLMNDHRLRQTMLTDQRTEEIADNLLLEEGLNDYVDRLIYATAAHLNYGLLTEDKDLHRIGRSGKLDKPKKITNWEKLIQEL